LLVRSSTPLLLGEKLYLGIARIVEESGLALGIAIDHQFDKKVVKGREINSTTLIGNCSCEENRPFENYV